MGQKSADLAREVSTEVRALVEQLLDITEHAQDALDYLAGYTNEA